MRLSEALERAREALCDTDADDYALCSALNDLIEAIEAYLEAQRKEAREIVGLADLQKWGGE